jgi:uncharacterized protein YjdB
MEMRFKTVSVLVAAICAATACSDDLNRPTNARADSSQLEAARRPTSASTVVATASECASSQPGWIFCDDFESNRLAKYFEYDNAGGKFIPTPGAGVNGSVGMRATYTKGQQAAGNLKLAFGRTPNTYMKPVDAGVANYREIYWRVYSRREPGWVGNGPAKLTRATSLAKADWSQAMSAHAWSDETDMRYLMLDPASGTDTKGTLVASGYNDMAHQRWLGGVRSAETEEDQAHVGLWRCYEFHVKLNDAGKSNGLFEMSVNGQSSARDLNLNWVGSYAAYGLNAIFLEQYQNDGAPAANVRTLDNFVVSTKPIGCGTSTTVPTAPAVIPVASIAMTPAAGTGPVGMSGQLTAVTKDVKGNTLTGRTVVFASKDSTIASVTPSGVVTALAPGSTTVTATSEGVVGQASVTVTAIPVAALAITPASTSGIVGQTVTLTTAAVDASGKTIASHAPTWKSSSAAVTVSSAGVATMAAVGSATITATVDGKTATATVTVTQTPVSALVATLTATTIQVGKTTQALTTIKDLLGTLLTGRVVTWTSSKPSVATVSSTGVVTGVAPGTASIIATSEGKSSATTVTVMSAVASPPTGPASPTGPSAPVGGSSGATSGTPWVADDFSSYTSSANFVSDPRQIYNKIEDMNTQQMVIDNTVGLNIGGHNLKQSLRYDYPSQVSNVQGAQTGRCGDYYVARSMNLPANAKVDQIWMEFYVKFSANFTTIAPKSWGCTGNPDFKTIFIKTYPDSRFQLKTGTSAQGETAPIYRWWARYPSGPDEDNYAVNAYDGQWHRVQMYAKRSTTASSKDGAYKVWIDGAVAYNAQGVNTLSNSGGAITSLYGAWLGQNMNQGPGQLQSMWWGYWAFYNTNPGW